MTAPKIACVVTGSRDWTDYAAIGKWLRRLPVGSTVIHGCARGADSIAEEIALAMGHKVERFPASDYGEWPEAGNKRNAAMIARLSDLRALGWRCGVLAFPPPPRPSGTRNCMSLARDAGFKVIVEESAQCRET